MHPFQAKIEFTKTPKCAELFLAGTHLFIGPISFILFVCSVETEYCFIRKIAFNSEIQTSSRRFWNYTSLMFFFFFFFFFVVVFILSDIKSSKGALGTLH